MRDNQIKRKELVAKVVNCLFWAFYGGETDHNTEDNLYETNLGGFNALFSFFPKTIASITDKEIRAELKPIKIEYLANDDDETSEFTDDRFKEAFKEIKRAIKRGGWA